MTRTKLAVIAAAAAMAAAGTGVAVGHVAGDDAKEREAAVLDRAAQQLEVSPDELRDALGEALDAQLDEAVKEGRLTQEQADEIKRHRQEEGTVLGLGGPPHHGGPGHRGPGGPGGHELFGDLADALGVSERRLHTQLRRGRTLAQIAKAAGKDVADVKAAVRAKAKDRLDAAVADGDLTRAQADEMLEHLGEHLDRLGQGGRGFGPPGGPGHRGP